MEACFRCGQCGLFVELGYGDEPSDSKFGTHTMLMCWSCGTGHRILHAKPPNPDLEFDSWEVRITSPGEEKIKLLTAIRQARNVGINQAHDLYDSIPFTLINVKDRAVAKQWAETIMSFGAGVQVMGRGQTSMMPAIAADALQGQIGPCMKLGAGLKDLHYSEMWEDMKVEGPKVGPTARFDHKQQICNYCSEQGFLTRGTPDAPMPCPKCRAGTLDPVDTLTPLEDLLAINPDLVHDADEPAE